MAILRGTIGVVFTFTVKREAVPLDISAATTKRLLFKQPNGPSLTKEASFATDGLDGKLTYTTLSGDLSEAGRWFVAAYVEMPGWTGQTTAAPFTVSDTI